MSQDQQAVVVERALLEAEVTRIVDAVELAGGQIRVLGSIAVALHCHDAKALIPSFERTYADIDFAAYLGDARAIAAALAPLGYEEDREVQITSEGRRAIFDNPATRLHLDVFYDRLEFCHVIPLAGRLDADRPTIPLAELLLSKLQIVKLNQKDVVDIVLLLLDHELGEGDDNVIDEGRIARLCTDDWGLWRTITMNLEKVRALAESYPQLDDGQRARVDAATARLKGTIDGTSKPLAWRLRDRVGDRRQWWTDVDEVR